MLYDADDRLVYSIPTQYRLEVPLDRMSRHLQNAIVAVEDARFYDHDGIDGVRVIGAILVELREGRPAEGASTITQQLARLSFLTSDKTLRRKVREAILAQRIEQLYSKEAILEMYLNKVYFGDGLYGAEAAARGYFGKPALDLTLAEASMLAGLVKAPSATNPTIGMKRAIDRRNIVLKLMRQHGHIDRGAYESAVVEKVVLHDNLRHEDPSLHFKETVRRQLIDELGKHAVYNGGLRVYTTIDPEMQRAAEAAVSDTLTEIDTAGLSPRRTSSRLRCAGVPAICRATVVALPPRWCTATTSCGAESRGADALPMSPTMCRTPIHPLRSPPSKTRLPPSSTGISRPSCLHRCLSRHRLQDRSTIAPSLSQQIYPPARLVAPKAQEHYAKHLIAARMRGREPVAALPSTDVIERLINEAFWASLRREEGYVPKISLAFLPPEHNEHPMLVERPLPLTPGTLTKIAAIVEHAGIHLGVWEYEGELCIWGTTHNIPTFCFVLEVVEPGLIVLKHHRGEQSGKYVNVAVLEGDQIKMVDETASSLPDCPDLLTSLLGFDSPASWVDSVNVLVQLAVAMRSHGRGGSLLVVPAHSDQWRESIVHPVPYAVSPPFRELTELMRETGAGREAEVWKEALREAVQAIAALTAVDGAAIITENYELLAFGAKIMRRRGATPVESVVVTEPVEGGVALITSAAHLGGTRHLSAAQFVHDQRKAIALVASQDRRFTVFAWSPCEDSVHAHRVEVLLL